MYLVGAPHPNKDAALRLLTSSIQRGERLVTDAEVLQEILHRYAAINRRDAIQPAFSLMRELVDQVFPVDVQDVEAAKTLMLGMPVLSARDALHVASMRRYEVSRILTFDRDFDSVPGIERIT